MSRMSEIEAALRSAFPHFADNQPITPEAIARVGAEWQDMVVNWAPFQTVVTFSDQDGNTRKIEWFDAEPDVGCFSGYVMPEGADWLVTTPSAADEIERLRKRLADCVVWMDTREKQQPGMPRICDMARRVLIGEPSTGG